ncbi:hypothetical protein KI387_015149, partial [Taxus chinensis]
LQKKDMVATMLSQMLIMKVIQGQQRLWLCKTNYILDSAHGHSLRTVVYGHSFSLMMVDGLGVRRMKNLQGSLGSQSTIVAGKAMIDDDIPEDTKGVNPPHYDVQKLKEKGLFQLLGSLSL